jgi:uncharacterized protein YqgC (DUF456 family)
MPYILLVTLFSLALLPGIFLSLVPGIPGILYMLAVAIGFGFVDHFAHLSGLDIGILSAVVALALLVDFVSGIAGAKWGGAHWSSILWGIVGLVLGSLFIPVPIFGSIIGMFLGVLASEFYRTKDVRLANKAAVGSFIGWLVGTGIKVIASIVFMVAFIVLVLI